MNIEQPDFSSPRLVRLEPHFSAHLTEFRSTDPVSRGAGCGTCGREWDNQGDLIKDVD